MGAKYNDLADGVASIAVFLMSHLLHTKTLDKVIETLYLALSNSC